MAKKKKRGGKTYLDGFRDWAVAGGAENQALTNPYELIRLKVKGGVAMVYRTGKGTETWNELADAMRTRFLANEPFPERYRPIERVGKDRTTYITHVTLIERDGDGCFFCGEEKKKDMTIEHLVPRAHGGPNHISNKFRACSPCNMRAGHLSAPEKIRIREARVIAALVSEITQPVGMQTTAAASTLPAQTN